MDSTKIALDKRLLTSSLKRLQHPTLPLSMVQFLFLTDDTFTKISEVIAEMPAL